MKNLLLPLLLVSLVMVQTGCRKVLNNDGPRVTELREIDENYEEIHLEGSIDLIVNQTEDYELKIEAGQRLMPYIKTRVFEDRLEIYEEPNNFYQEEPIRVFVSKEYLDDIYLLGSGDIDASGIIAGNSNIEVDGSGDIDIEYAAVETVTLKIDGSGDARFTGAAQQITVNIDGSGDVDARYLETSACYINVDGSGNTRVTVFEYLNVDIDGSGDVRYWGNPADVDASITGSGDLIDME